jgi:hypothetical protein
MMPHRAECDLTLALLLLSCALYINASSTDSTSHDTLRREFPALPTHDELCSKQTNQHKEHIDKDTLKELCEHDFGQHILPSYINMEILHTKNGKPPSSWYASTDDLCVTDKELCDPKAKFLKTASNTEQLSSKMRRSTTPERSNLVNELWDYVSALGDKPIQFLLHAADGRLALRSGPGFTVEEVDKRTLALVTAKPSVMATIAETLALSSVSPVPVRAHRGLLQPSNLASMCRDSACEDTTHLCSCIGIAFHASPH